MSLSQITVSIVKATAPGVTQNAEKITSRMYEILFTDYPETKALFENSDSNQHKKLAVVISAYAANIDNLGALSKAVKKMAATHISSKVKAEYYPMVGVSLLAAVKDSLGEAATDDVINAWKEADILI